MAVPSFPEAFLLGMRLLFFGDFTITYDLVKFRKSCLPFKKRIKIFLQSTQYFMRPLKRIGTPLILQLEPTNMCNLRCLTCATGAGLMKRPPTKMGFNTYRHIIDQVKKDVCLVAFWSWGEPFMNSEACKMIRYAKQNDLLVHTSTNGHFFTTRRMAREVVESGLDSIVFAVDGLDEVTYARYRRNGRFEKTIQSIKNLIEERNIAGVKHPFTVFRFIMMKHNEHQLDGVKSFAKDLGVDAISLRSAVVTRSGLDLKNTLAPQTDQYRQFLCQESSVKKNRIKIPRAVCRRPYATLTIFSNGDVVLCENDFNATMVLGNAKKQTIHEILTSQKAKGFLRVFNRELDDVHFCQECEFREMKRSTPNIETHIFQSERLDE